MTYPNVPRGARARPSTASGNAIRPAIRSRGSLVLSATHGLVASAPLQDDAASLIVWNHLGASLLLRWDTTDPTATDWHDRVPPYSFAVLPVPINARLIKALVSYASGSALAADTRAVLYTHAAVLPADLVPMSAVGNIAHDAPDAGNPMKIGGYASSSVPTAVAAGDRVNAWYGLNGQAAVLVAGASGNQATVTATGDAVSGGSGALITGSFNHHYNGSSWERGRPNTAASYLASAARTASPTVADITTYNARGIRVSIDVTAFAATPSVVPTIEVKDAVAGTYTAILTGAAITGTGHVELVVMPGITPAANVAAAMAIARTMRVSMTHGDADSITYSVAVELLV